MQGLRRRVCQHSGLPGADVTASAARLARCLAHDKASLMILPLFLLNTCSVLPLGEAQPKVADLSHGRIETHPQDRTPPPGPFSFDLNETPADDCLSGGGGDNATDGLVEKVSSPLPGGSRGPPLPTETRALLSLGSHSGPLATGPLASAGQKQPLYLPAPSLCPPEVTACRSMTPLCENCAPNAGQLQRGPPAVPERPVWPEGQAGRTGLRGK